MMSEKNIAAKVWQDPAYFIAFGFGSGLMPIAPGTWGTLAAFPIYLLLTFFTPTVYLIITFILFLLGVFVSEKVTREVGVSDYSGIVWDEVIGFLLTMAGAPLGILWMITGFFLFRLFDIWKPFPIRYIDQKIHGGLGVMLDDVLAALPAWLIMQALVWVFVS